MLTMTRIFLPLVFAIIHWDNYRGSAPIAQAFPQEACRKLSQKKDTFSKIHHEDAPHRSPRRRRRSPVADTLLGMKKDVSKNVSLDASNVVGNFKRSYLPWIALGSLSLTTLAAFTDYLPGPPIDATPPPFFATIPFGVIDSGSCDTYWPALIGRDLFSTIVSILGAAIFVKGITYPAKLGKIESRDSRKIIHTLSAPLFLLCWPIFSNAYGARVFASIVPLLNTFRLIAAGTDGSDTELAGAISRSGDAKEALGGPFIYVLVLLGCTLIFWTDSPIGIVAISTMAVGDGLADLIGRRYGSSNKWFFNKQKSMAGSAAFVLGSFVASCVLLVHLGLGPLQANTILRLFAIATVCAGVELIPVGDDNWTVPASAAILSAILLD